MDSASIRQSGSGLMATGIALNAISVELKNFPMY